MTQCWQSNVTTEAAGVVERAGVVALAVAAGVINFIVVVLFLLVLILVIVLILIIVIVLPVLLLIIIIVLLVLVIVILVLVLLVLVLDSCSCYRSCSIVDRGSGSGMMLCSPIPRPLNLHSCPQTQSTPKSTLQAVQAVRRAGRALPFQAHFASGYRTRLSRRLLARLLLCSHS